MYLAELYFENGLLELKIVNSDIISKNNSIINICC